MSELYTTIHPYNRKINLAYYSEKGWINFFLNYMLPQSPIEYLCFFEDPAHNKPFLLTSRIISFIIFNEMDLGEVNGFGRVDGGIYLESEKENYFIFIQALNDCYKNQCTVPEKAKLAFQKSINGQLELIYRFSIAVKNGLNKDSTDIISENLPNLHENYLKSDKFYIIPDKKFEKKKVRKLKLSPNPSKNMIKSFFKKDTKFYFLIATDDKINPFSRNNNDFHEHYTPRIYPDKKSEDLWEESKKYFLWLPKNLITNQINPELSDCSNCPMAKYCFYYSGSRDFSTEKIAFETREDVPQIGPTSHTKMDLEMF